MKNPKHFSKKLALPLMAAGCLMAGCEVPKEAPLGATHLSSTSSSPYNTCYVETFPRHVSSPSCQSLDVLFVVDGSSSLNDEKSRIASFIDSFISGLPSGVDYQFAVMPAHGSLGSHSGRLFSYKSNPIVLSSKTMSVSKIRGYLHDNITNVPSDPQSDGGEEGLYSLYRSMDSGKASAIRAHGFYRQNAALSVIFVSDENDICARYPAGVKPVVDPEGSEVASFKRDCAGVDEHSVYARLLNFQQGRPLSVNGIVYSNLNTVPKGKSAGEDEYGYGYMDIIKLAGGVAVDLSDLSQYDSGLFKIAQHTGQQMDGTVDFLLSQKPVNPYSISVKLFNSNSDPNRGCFCEDARTLPAGVAPKCYNSNGAPVSSCTLPPNSGSGNGCVCEDARTLPAGVAPKCYDDAQRPVASCKPDNGHGKPSDKDDHDDKSSSSGSSSGRLVEFTFNGDTNIVHILDPNAPENTAEISYCLKPVIPSPTPTPSVTVTPSPSPSPTPSVTVTPSPTPTPSVTVTPSPTPSPSVTVTPSPSPSPSPTVTVTPSPTPSPSVTVTPSPTPTPSVTVTPSPTPSPSPTVTVEPSPTPSPTPTVDPSPSPTVTPSPSPSPTGCTGPFCGGGILGA